jgi:hypothetical protein
MFRSSTAITVLTVLVATACGGTPPAAPDALTSDAASPADAAPDAASPPPGRLRVSGARVLDPAGDEIILRGYNWGAWGAAIEEDADANLVQGANSVRIPLRWWGDWKPGVDCRDDRAVDTARINPAHLDILDDMVDWASSRGLWFVLFVDSNHGQGAGPNPDDNFWTNPVERQRFVEVWQFLVERYRDRPFLAAYEILPEPRPPGVSDAAVKDFYDGIIPVIRALDPRTPIVVGPNDAYSLNRLAAAHTTVDANIIYTGNYFIFSRPLNRIQYITSFREDLDAPVWINQVGIESGDDNALENAEDVLEELERLQVGWAWWTYRIVGENPDAHGIYYQDEDGTWQLKRDWFELVGSFLD